MLSNSKTFIALSFALSLFFSELAFCEDLSESLEGFDSSKYPEQLLAQFKRSDNLEQITASSLRVIRTTGRDPVYIDASDIDELKRKAILHERKIQVASLLDYDSNNDGVIDSSEMTLALKNNRTSVLIKSIDINNDGTIDFAEMRTVTKANKVKIDARFSDLEKLLLLDPNDDGKITVEEYSTVINKLFLMVDLDKDHVLNPGEKYFLDRKSKALKHARQKCSLPFMDVHDNRKEYSAFKSKRLTAYINTGVPNNQEYELHVVGSYEGPGRIRIKPSNKPLILVLASHKASIWLLEVLPGAMIKEIILQGNKDQKIKGVPDGVELTRRPANCAGYASSWFPADRFDGKTSASFSGFISNIQKFTGLIETTFQGAYRLEEKLDIPLNEQQYKRHVIAFEDPSTKSSHAESLQKYKNFHNSIPGKLKPTLLLLIGLMETGKFPVQFPNAEPGGKRESAKYFEEFNYDISALKASKTHPDIECKNRDIAMLIGDDTSNILSCGRGNQIIWGGGDTDHINDAWGNDIINGGEGDDVLDAGWGRDIIVFEKDWGADIVSKTCHDSKIYDASRLYGFERNTDWSYPYINFIVFGPGVFQEDMIWDGNIYMNTVTGDQITFKDKCFNYVFYEDKRQ